MHMLKTLCRPIGELILHLGQELFPWRGYGDDQTLSAVGYHIIEIVRTGRVKSPSIVRFMILFPSKS